jgi:hypothetical protein
MSRYSLIQPNGDVVSYGFDHACGYFIQVQKPDDDVPSVDLDSVGMGTTNEGPMSNSAMLEQFEAYGVPVMHRTMLALDMPF